MQQGIIYLDAYLNSDMDKFWPVPEFFLSGTPTRNLPVDGSPCTSITPSDLSARLELICSSVRVYARQCLMTAYSDGTNDGT